MEKRRKEIPLDLQLILTPSFVLNILQPTDPVTLVSSAVATADMAERAASVDMAVMAVVMAETAVDMPEMELQQPAHHTAQLMMPTEQLWIPLRLLLHMPGRTKCQKHHRSK